MKISKEQKRRIKRTIIEAAVKVVDKVGFKAATMRAIASEAGVGDATIYNYFPAKDKILYAYFELQLEATLKELMELEDYQHYSAQEKLQALLEINLLRLKADRAFVKEVFELAYISALGRYGDAAQARKRMSAFVEEVIETAAAVGEIPDQPYTTFISGLFWDYYLGILIYWLKDQSEDYNDTSRLIDLSLGLVAAILHSGIIAKGADLASFLIRTHLYDGMERMQSILSGLQKEYGEQHGKRT